MSADEPRRRFEHFRHRTLRELEYQKSVGRLESDEFERRSALARRAASAVDLRPLLEDLAVGADRPPVARATEARTTSMPRPAGGDSDFALAVMSSAVREGRWTPPRTVHALALMGGVKLDFRDADLLEGTTHVHAWAIMGGVTVIVPPDVQVIVKGVGFMGGFGRTRRGAAAPDAPCIRIDGFALMGGVDVKVRDSVELDDDA